MQPVDTYFGSQVLTLAVPLGTFIAVCLWGFFQRHNPE